MNDETTQKLEDMFSRSESPSRLLEIEDVSIGRGELMIPAVPEVSLALAHTNHSASWRGTYAMQTREFPEGTVALCPFATAFNIEFAKPSDFSVVLLRNEALQEAHEEEGQFIGASFPFEPTIFDPTLRDLMLVLQREKQKRFANGKLFLDSIATALASYLIAQFGTKTRSLKGLGGLAPNLLRRSVDFIESALDQDLRLQELARNVGLSSSHFIRSFRESTGMTPYQFLLKRRIERAKALMRDSYRPLSQVALETGFADQHHFSRTFRRITHMTPSAYRRQLS